MLFPFITGKNFFFRIIVELITGVWFILAVINPAYRLRRSPLTLALGGFLIIVTLATIFGSDPAMSFWSNFERMEGLVTYLHLGALFVVLSNILRTPRDWAYLFHGSLAVSLVVTFYALLQARGLVAIVGEYRPYAWFGNSIYLAEYLLFHFFITLFFLIYSREVWARVAYTAVLVAEGYIFFIAASRGAFIGFVAGVFVVLVGFLLKTSSRRVRLSIIGGFVALVLLAVFVFYQPNNILTRHVEVLERLVTVSSSSLKNDPRILIWGIGWRAFLERPLLGWGPGNFIEPYSRLYNPELHGNEPWFDRVHNMFLEWLVATGSIGFFSYLAVFGAAFFALWRGIQQKKIDWRLALFLASTGVAYLIQNAFVFDTIGTYLALLFWFAALYSLTQSLLSVQQSKRIRSKSISTMHGILMICVGISVMSIIYFVNIPAMQAARGILQALQEFSSGAPLGEIRKTLAYTEDLDTFGTLELHERFGNEVMNVVLERESHVLAAALLDDAIRGFEYETRHYPESAKRQLFLGRLYAVRFNLKHNEADFRAAEDAYRKALSIAPQYIQNHVAFAELYLMGNRPDDAAELIRGAFALAPQSEEMMHVALAVYLLADKPDEALRMLDEHMRKDTKLPNMTNFGRDEITRVAQLSRYVKNVSARLHFLKEFARWASPSPELYRVIALTSAEAGDKVSARLYAEKTLDLNPLLQGELGTLLNDASSSPDR
ncbi:MAG: O-antigen ligase family protein [Patescibacteria group bacterium]